MGNSILTTRDTVIPVPHMLLIPATSLKTVTGAFFHSACWPVHMTVTKVCAMHE